MHAERHTVDITTAADGTGTGYTPNVTGRVQSIQYVKTDYDNGVDFTITAEATTQSILALTDQNASGTWAPRQPTHSQAGAAALYAAGGTAVGDHILLANDRVKIAVAQGGNVKTGRFIVTIG